MYCLKFTIQPTAAMTFRILPGSILNIATYPFVPPTTLSGFLRRLGMMSVGEELPETRVNNDNPPTYTLPPRYIALGAYPSRGEGKMHGIHRTYRKGMDKFGHDAFSRIYQSDNKENFQLHTWEYFIADELEGYIVADSLDGLEHFQELKNRGCKLGKEGFAIVTEISQQPIELEHKSVAAHPSTIVPMEDLLQGGQFLGGCDIYNLYRYQWASTSQSTSNRAGFLDSNPTEVDGFIPFVSAYFPQAGYHLPELKYYTNNNDINIPVSLVNLLKGTINV
jgi:hypothetical protein